MQVALRPDSSGHGLRSGRSQSGTQVNRLMAAGVAVIGASLIAVNPLAPNVVSSTEYRAIEHRAVQLTSGISDVVSDYQDVVSQAVTNLQTLGGEAGVAIPGLLQQIGANLSGTGGLLNTAFSGTESALQSALYSGWYGGDDGFVFGLLGGTLTHNGVTESGSTLQEILTALGQGNFYSAYSFYDTWSLEALQHITKPLLSPILSTSRAGSLPTPTLPGQFLQTLTNVAETFLNYNNLQSLTGALLSPQISVTFGFLGDLGNIGTDLSSGNFGGAVTDTLKVPADLLGDLLNGYINPNTVFNPTGKAFTGLLNSGSLLQQLLYTWPNELAAALGGSSTGTLTSASAQAGVSLSNVLAPAASLLPNLANAVQPSLLAGNLSSTIGPLLANAAAQLSATLTPNLISGLLLHLPSLLLALL